MQITTLKPSYPVLLGRMFMTFLALAILSPVGQCLATIPYGSVSPGTPVIGPGVAPPSIVTGKEYVHDMDHIATAAGVALDPQHVVPWDGSGGVGIGAGVDFSFTRPTFMFEDDIDAIANHDDFLLDALISDDAHLVYSVDDMFVGYSFGAPFLGSVPSTGPIMLPFNTIGGAGELSRELAFLGGANPADSHSLWAAGVAINGMPTPDDIDGVEVWGPEPAFIADTDKYSLSPDSASGGLGPLGGSVSVWNGSGTAYLDQSIIIGAVTALLGAPVSSAIDLMEVVDVDAHMINDRDVLDRFELATPVSPGDTIVFSIKQIPDAADPDGYYATGSELFVLDAMGASFLMHGGHLWDHAYSLAAFEFFSMDPNNFGVIDINAIEAIGETVVPEPAGLLLISTLFACLLIGARARKVSVTTESVGNTNRRR